MAAGFFGKKVPGSFLPDEDQGYLYAGLQLPDASSLQRSSEAAREVEKIIMETPGVENVSSVMGYSMLSGVNATYSSFFFVSFKPWDERKTPETSYDGIKAHLQRALSKVPSGLAFSFPPPAIPGVGTSGGVTFILEDRSGSGIDFLAKNTQVFMAEARKRPELAGRDDHRALRRSAGRSEGGQRQGDDPADPAEQSVPDRADVHGRRRW